MAALGSDHNIGGFHSFFLAETTQSLRLPAVPVTLVAGYPSPPLTLSSLFNWSPTFTNTALAVQCNASVTEGKISLDCKMVFQEERGY